MLNATPLVRAIDPEMLRRAASIIKLLGHPERLKIVEALEGSERSVSEICEICDLEQAICSQHLSRLRRYQVVSARKDGQHVWYRVVEPKVHHILECIRKCDTSS
ncbi:MAG: winged helix-turn-helix transcriptional regulator [Gemmatimonadales bacterium]|nr:winged helix-turn-helix transcriptional regulator [Gemmatimonadales bacterium]